MTYKTLRCLIPITLVTAVFAGCDSQTYRDSVNQNNDSFTQARKDEMQPAVGIYKGTMTMNLDNGQTQPFDCQVEVDSTSDVVLISEGPDPAEKVEVPKLEGNLSFPVFKDIAEEDVASYKILTAPMGGNFTVMFSSGNFNPRTNELILPYGVPGYSLGNLGQLDGKLTNGEYKGTWYSKGAVGTFDLTQTERTTQ